MPSHADVCCGILENTSNGYLNSKPEVDEFLELEKGGAEP